MRTLGCIGAAVVLVAACSGGATPTPPTTTPASAATTAPATSPPAPSVLVTPVPTNAAGIRTCVSSSDGPEVACPLESGTYATAFFSPAVTYTVPSTGWSSLNRAAAPGNFHLFPAGGGSIEAFQEGTTDAISIVAAAVPPGRCTGEPSTELEPTFDGLVEFLTTNPRLTVSNVHDVTVGGLDGTAMDVAFRAADGCVDGDYTDFFVGVSPSHGAFGITQAQAGSRLYVLRVAGRDAPLVIEVDDAKNGGSDYGDGDAWYTVAQAVIDTIAFTP